MGSLSLGRGPKVDNWIDQRAGRGEGTTQGGCWTRLESRTLIKTDAPRRGVPVALRSLRYRLCGLTDLCELTRRPLVEYLVFTQVSYLVFTQVSFVWAN